MQIFSHPGRQIVNKESTFTALFEAIDRLASAGQSITIGPAFPGVADCSTIVSTGGDHFHLDCDLRKSIVAATNWLNSKGVPDRE
jgi:hypothetical protein